MKSRKVLVIPVVFLVVCSIITGTYFFVPFTKGSIEISIKIDSQANPEQIVYEPKEYLYELKYSHTRISSSDLLDNFSICIPEEWSSVDNNLYLKENIAIKSDEIYIAVYANNSLIYTWGGISNRDYSPISWVRTLRIEVWNRDAGPDPEFSQN